MINNHYLLDQFASPISSATVLDVAEPVNGQTVTNGAFVVRVPGYVALSTQPSSLSSLLTEKYAGLLAHFTGFTNIVYDDMLDTGGVNFATTPAAFFGDRGAIGISPGGILETVTIPLVLTPSLAILTWELSTFTYSDPANGRLTRTYNEVPSNPSAATVTVSFNNGANYASTTDGTSIIIGNQGDDLRIRFQNVTSSRLYLNSWALIY